MELMKKHSRFVQRGVFVCMLLVAASAVQAGWYRVQVHAVAPRTDSGDVVVQLRPGDGVDTSGWSLENGVVRGIVPGNAEGSSEVLAVLLTAVALSSEITVEMADTPAWSPAQVISGTGLIAP
jgi:hypothetical protein